MGIFQESIPPTPPNIDLSGQTIIITGATAGLGYESAVQFLRLKAHTVILGVRNLEKASTVRRELLNDREVQLKNPSADVKTFQLDLIDYDSVIRFANKVYDTTQRLDVLLLNAGMNLARYEKSPVGHEMYFWPIIV